MALALMLLAGCSDSLVKEKPQNQEMIGTWLLDKNLSSCPRELLILGTKIVLNEDGKFSDGNLIRRTANSKWEMES